MIDRTYLTLFHTGTRNSPFGIVTRPDEWVCDDCANIKKRCYVLRTSRPILVVLPCATCCNGDFNRHPLHDKNLERVDSSWADEPERMAEYIATRKKAPTITHSAFRSESIPQEVRAATPTVRR